MELEDVGSNPAWTSQGLQKTGMIMLVVIQDLVSVQMIIYHWVVTLLKSVDLVFFILSLYQYYIGIMNSCKKKACISCV